MTHNIGKEREAGSGSRGNASHPPLESLSKVQALYDAGLNLQAYKAAVEFCPLKEWQGAARTLAGRVATNVGGHRLGHALHWLAWRADKRNPDFVSYTAYRLLGRRGPLATHELFERLGQPSLDSKPDELLHYFTVRAMVAGHLRDFTAAEQYYQEAAKSDPQHPWLITTRARLFELEDRYDEALESARHTLEIRPWYRPGVQAVAHALQILDRDEEALDLLTKAAQQIECMHVVRQLALLQDELGLYDDEAASLDQFEALAPLMEKQERSWLERQRITLACSRRDRVTALAGAQKILEPLYLELTQRLQTEKEYRRRRLDVPFVRQHHMTCAPATLSAISRFWEKTAKHLEVAEAICYDGTPAHSERHWADNNGWVTREFKVTWEAAVALLDRGIPFTLTTSEVTSGHLQAVVGYDELRETLWIRDPFVYTTGEFPIKPLLERYAATGPRGMAMVPVEKRQLLDGLDLPEAGLYDQLHAVNRALQQHRRDDALKFCLQMQDENPKHRLTLTARRSMASYDANTPALLECLEELLKLYPENGNLSLVKFNCLRELAGREDRLNYVGQLSSKRGCDPVFWQCYAQELRADARQHRAAASWVRWSLRYRPNDPGLVCSWADLLWDRRDFESATSYYRLGACLGDKNELHAWNFFLASRHLRRTDAALAFLRERNERLGRKSSAPTVTLVRALHQIGSTNEALQRLDEALTRRPNDGALLLFAADFHGRFSNFTRAEELLQEARNHCGPAAWHRASATVANYQSKKLDALANWRAVLKFEPLGHDASQAVTLLLAETEGRQTALSFVDELSERFPYSCPLLRFRIEWLRSDGYQVAIPHIRRLLEVNAADAWGWRELALGLAENGQTREALDAANEAIRLEPNRSQGYCIRAKVFLRNQQIPEARTDLREAVRLEVDNRMAVSQFVASAPTLAERKQALAIVEEELRRQVIFDDALSSYKEAARGILPPEDVLRLLKDAHKARPNLWQAWSVLINHLTDMSRFDEALALAQEATKNFPLLPRLYVDLARVEHARLNTAGEIAALEQALGINQAYAHASQQLAGIHSDQAEWAKAKKVLTDAIAANPLDAVNQGSLAYMLWASGERGAAIERAQNAIRLQPGYDWAWRQLLQWGRTSGKPELAVEMARDLTRTRAGEARSWLYLAQCLTPDSNAGREALTEAIMAEIFSALDRALELNPRSEEAYDRRAYLLSRANRFDEALAQCKPAAFQTPPGRLRIRAAWIQAQRGNVAQAIIQATETLADHPDHYNGWKMLSEWCWQTKQADKAVHAAEKMALLAPLDAVPLGYLGDLKLNSGDKAGARDAFQRAFKLNPDYEYAGFELFKLQLSGREFQSAAQTLKQLERKGKTHQTIAISVELAAAKGEWPAALEAFESLCEIEHAERWSLSKAIKALDTGGYRKSLDKILNKCIVKAKCSPALAECWVQRKIAGGRWNLHGRLNALKAEGEIGRRAVLCYLDQMGEACNLARRKKDVTGSLKLRFHFWRLLKQHREWLKKDVEGWGKVGYVLTSAGRAGPTIAWLSDWKSRPNAESWMLYNLVLMLHRKGRYEEGREIIRHAVSLRHERELYGTFRLWAAFEEAVEGNDDLALQHLALLPTEDVKEYYQPLFPMTRLLLDLRKGGVSNNTRFKEVRDKVKSIFGTTRPSKRVLYVRDGYGRLLKAAAPTAGGLQLRLWGLWYYRQIAWFKVMGLMMLVPLAFVIPPLLIPAAIIWVRYSKRD